MVRRARDVIDINMWEVTLKDSPPFEFPAIKSYLFRDARLMLQLLTITCQECFCVKRVIDLVLEGGNPPSYPT